jgi:hypothetical protein
LMSALNLRRPQGEVWKEGMEMDKGRGVCSAF